VSTPVADVVRHFVPLVTVAESADEYVAAINGALGQPDADRRQHAIERARQSSWESITGDMTLLIEEAIAVRHRRRGPERLAGISTAARTEHGVRRAP
jgi:hypothetical protein